MTERVLSDRTKHEYERCISALKVDLVKTKPQKVVEKILSLDLSISRIQTYLSAILWYLRTNSPQTDVTVYKEKLKGTFEASRERQKAQKLAGSAQEKYLNWTDILALREKVIKEFGEKSQEYICFLLYTLQPPVRGDYAGMKVVSRVNQGKGNRVAVGKSYSTFVFEEYKTAHTYNTVKLRAPKELHTVLKGWVEGRQTLLDVETPSGLFALLRRIFQRVSGKEISVNILRHSYITFFLSSPRSIKEKEEVARRMLHSKEIQETYHIFE